MTEVAATSAALDGPSPPTGAGRVRNMCILAHVDHGKTTLADALVASNGLISRRLAGKLRYMDSRPDEQERGITMKSSAVTLTYVDEHEQTDGGANTTYVINLIDSPGHVDFSSEVSTAVRLCDGALVLVDVVEGVQPQTKVVLAQAWREGIRPLLVLNKLDRLITETQLDPLSAYRRLRGVLEQVNAVIGELFASDVMMNQHDEIRRQMSNDRQRLLSTSSKSEHDRPHEEKKKENDQHDDFDWSTGLEEADDSDLYFSPEHGNVLFASAADGWAFDLATFAAILSQKLGLSQRALAQTLWGDFYVAAKAKRIMRGADAKGKKPLFVQLILENIWAVYEATRDKDKLASIVEKLNIKVAARDLRASADGGRQQAAAVLSLWLPLAPAVLRLAVAQLPAPTSLAAARAQSLMCPRNRRFDALPPATQQLKEAFMKCSAASDAPLIVFVSKMIPVPTKSLPKNRPKPLTEEEMSRRRERAKQRLAAAAAGDKEEKAAVAGEALSSEALERLKLNADGQRQRTKSEANDEDEETSFIAFARVFSGCLKPGQELFVLGPKHNPAEALANKESGQEFFDETADIHNNPKGWPIFKATVSEVYLLAGRDLQELKEAPAGSVIGVAGLERFILKSATLSDTIACPPFVETTASSAPILRVAVEPVLSSDLHRLERGLALLNQADANVQVSVTSKGEHVLATAGEVHLERCLRDLRETYARVAVNASSPIVPFRETIVPTPKTDMVNEQVGEENRLTTKDEVGGQGTKEENTNEVTLYTANKRVRLTIKAMPLPKAATAALEEAVDVLKAWDREEAVAAASTAGVGGSISASEELVSAKEALKDRLASILNDQNEEDGDEADPDLTGASLDKLWSVGPRRCGANLLINAVEDYCQHRPSWWERPPRRLSKSPVADLDSSIINGFQLATLSGPLCEEPMMGVAFIVKEVTVLAVEEERQAEDSSYGPLSGQVVSAIKEACRRAFQARHQRLVLAMYTCSVQAKAEVLGKLFASLGRRHGRVVSEEMIEGSSTFTVLAHLPVIESFQFAQEIRRQTSGLAMPQLVFSHWETLDVDPFWTPQTEEELLHFGDKADSESRARVYMNDIRKKKGLAIDEKIVEFAEKQRTLNKKK